MADEHASVLLTCNKNHYFFVNPLFIWGTVDILSIWKGFLLWMNGSLNLLYVFRVRMGASVWVLVEYMG